MICHIIYPLPKFGHLNTHPIIDPNIGKFQKGQHLGQNVRKLLVLNIQ